MPMDMMDREEISNKTEIEKLLEEIKNSAIGFENYKYYFDKLNNSDQVIMTQIENLQREYREYKAKTQKEEEKDSFKSLRDDGFVRIEHHENTLMQKKIILEAYNWKTLQEELHSIIQKKTARVLDDAKALDIKRDALKEMREMEEKRQAMFIEIMNNNTNMFRDVVTNKLQTFDEKFLQLVMMIDEDNRRDRKDIFDTLKKIVRDINVIEVKKRKIIVQQIQTEDTQTKKERLYTKEQEEKLKKEKKLEQQKLSAEEQDRMVRPNTEIDKEIKISENVKMDDIDEQFDDMDDEIVEEGGKYDKW